MIEISHDDLIDKVRDVAAAAFLVRFWPGKGSRHGYVLAAAGYLTRQLGAKLAQRIMSVAIHASGESRPRHLRALLSCGRPRRARHDTHDYSRRGLGVAN